jgi:hypothetical protein
MEFQRLEIERLKSEIELAQLQLDLERLLNTQSKSPSASLQKTDSKLKTPRMEPEVFCGDRMKYPLWWKSFEALIERATACESDRLFFLGKYTSGVAKEAIQSFLMSNDQDAYAKAKAVLRRRFGDKFKTAEIRSWKIGRISKQMMQQVSPSCQTSWISASKQ